MPLPEDCAVQESFPVARHHLDTNNHVNNGQYIAMAEEFLPEDFEASTLRVEYRAQAKLHDVIVPMLYREADSLTVGLCNEEGKPYAIVVYLR